MGAGGTQLPAVSLSASLAVAHLNGCGPLFCKGSKRHAPGPAETSPLCFSARCSGKPVRSRVVSAVVRRIAGLCAGRARPFIRQRDVIRRSAEPSRPPSRLEARPGAGRRAHGRPGVADGGAAGSGGRQPSVWPEPFSDLSRLAPSPLRPHVPAPRRRGCWPDGRAARASC